MYWGVITLGKCGGICRRIKGEQKKACFSLAQRPSFEFCVHVGVVQGLNGIQNPLRGVHHYKGYYTWWGITCGYANVIQVMLGKSGFWRIPSSCQKLFTLVVIMKSYPTKHVTI